MPAQRRIRMVSGPARVKIRGRCNVLGAQVSDSDVRVRSGKTLPFEAGARCRIQVKIGRGGGIWWADRVRAGTYMWKGVARAVLSTLESQRAAVIMIVGDTDTGKSTLCTYLANMALRQGIAPCLIDGDIGQGDLAPPSGIGAAVITYQVTDLRDMTASHFGFIGSISAAGVEHLIIDNIQSLIKRSRELARLVIVNTDGYTRDGGVGYKRKIAEAIQPDIIVHLGTNRPLEASLASGPWNLILARSIEQVVKSREERKWKRQDQFVRFAGSGNFHVSLSEMDFSYLGSRFSSSDLTSAQTAWFENLEGVFVGLGSDGEILGFGVIKNIHQGIVELVTDLNAFDTIYLSNIKLTGDGAEQFTLGMPDRKSRET